MRWNTCEGFNRVCKKPSKNPSGKLCNACIKRKQRTIKPGKAAKQLADWRKSHPEQTAQHNFRYYWSNRDLRLVTEKLRYQKNLMKELVLNTNGKEGDDE